MHSEFEGLGAAKMQAPPTPATPPSESATKADLLQVIQATNEELNQLRRQHWDLAAKLQKWEQRFEQWFQEEAAARLNPVKGYGIEAQAENPLSRLGRIGLGR